MNLTLNLLVVIVYCSILVHYLCALMVCFLCVYLVVVVQLDRPSYTVTEGDSVSVSVVTDRVSDKDVTVTLVTSDGPATGMPQFAP